MEPFTNTGDVGGYEYDDDYDSDGPGDGGVALVVLGLYFFGSLLGGMLAD